MKNIVTVVSFIIISILSLHAQDRNNEDEVIKVDPQMSQFNSIPNELLVKFKDASTVQMSKVGQNKIVSGISAIDRVIGQYDIEEIEQLIPNDNPNRVMRKAKTYSGQIVTETSMNQLYRVKIRTSSSKSNFQLIKELNAAPEVEFAEPNYIVSVFGQSEEKTFHSPKTSSKVLTNATYDYSTEPMYSLQWGIPAVKLDALWQKPNVTTKRQVIAIIDTGVDIEHPDLKDNIWTNPRELNKIEGVDDDNNGFVDDIHGWDFVNQTSKVKDFNSHGTHCAGIAAAIGDNGLGITGANPNALIMPIAVMQSNGSGDIATLIKGINYAAVNGADVISMSIGTYAYSIALEQTLAQAYQTSILVAAAGNDGIAIYQPCSRDSKKAFQLFPAAFTFVLGVQATEKFGALTNWSNYDCDGPIYSAFGEEKLFNYELKAPGADILSTIPGGQYRIYSGTSMATPLVAGGVSLLKQKKEFVTQEILWSTLIQSSGNNINFESAYHYTPKPQLNIIAIETNDTLQGDKDMRPDAGETIQIYPTIRNTGGSVDSIYFSLGFAEFEDNTIVEINQDSVKFGFSLSAYSKMKSKNPLTIKIKSNVVDGRNIKLVLKSWYGSKHQGEVSQNLTLNVENGVELKGMLTKDMTLYPDKHYIVTDNLAIPNGITLTIKPGTTIKFKENVNLSSAGKIIAIGNPDSMIIFTKTDLSNGLWNLSFGKDTLTYCVFEYRNFGKWFGDQPHYLSNCVIKYSTIDYNISSYDTFSKINLYYNYDVNRTYINSGKHLNFVHNVETTWQFPGGLLSTGLPISSNIFSNSKYNIKDISNTPTIYKYEFPNYYGSAKESIVRKGVFDFYTSGSGVFGVVDLSNMSIRPYAEAHGIVWKVVVNGYDAQDEFEMLPPLGVGKHKFEIYFNRPMNKSFAPFIAMGVRPPYTQNAIGEEGTWNVAGDIYTAYLTITGASTGDGLNRIYVANAKDNENFEIPYENQRFKVIVQAAGSMSNGFEAKPGLGKVNLHWETPDGYFDDLLGYNMYRYTNIQGVSSDTILVNSSLIADTTFTDFNVVPGKVYNYMYKVLRTNLTENDFSKVVSTTPLTATKGDANGSFTVDIADVVSTVNFATNQNPQPFIFEAADVNSDVKIDVLDIVGIVNIILKPQSAPAFKVNSSAIYSIENGMLYVDSPLPLGGVQFKIRGNRATSEIQPQESLNTFEQSSQWSNDSTYMLLAYSLSGKEIPQGKNALLKLGNGATLEQIVLSDTKGSNIISVSNNSTNLVKTEGNQMLRTYPNPFSTELRVPITICYNKLTHVEVIFSDLAGRTVDNLKIESAMGSNYEVVWRPSYKLSGGIYFCSLKINDRIIQTEKVIYQPVK